MARRRNDHSVSRQDPRRSAWSARGILCGPTATARTEKLDEEELCVAPVALQPVNPPRIRPEVLIVEHAADPQCVASALDVLCTR